jgi:redox-sensing transcriptional repressor
VLNNTPCIKDRDAIFRLHLNAFVLSAENGFSRPYWSKSVRGKMGKQSNVIYPLVFWSDSLLSCLGQRDVARVILVGVGNLGTSLLRCYSHFHRNVSIVAAFDREPSKIGGEINGIPIYSMEQFAEVQKEHDVKAAILTVTAQAAQEATDRIVAAGIRGVLNFTPVQPIVPPGGCLRSIDLSKELETWILTNIRSS